MTKRDPKQTKARILRTAAQYLVDQGIEPFTLEAVAKAAEVSKGGLLHHFPTKEVLLRGIILRLHEIFYEQFNTALASEPVGTPGRWSRAYINITFDPHPDEALFFGALNPMLQAYPNLHDWYLELWLKMPTVDTPNDGLPGARAAVIFAACDGIWLSNVGHVPSIVPADRAELRAELMRLTQ